jgi:Mycobacterium membrane protein
MASPSCPKQWLSYSCGPLPKPRKRWSKVIVGVVVGLILLSACSATVTDGNASPPVGVDSNGAPSLVDIVDIGKKTLTYSVVGSGGATVSYMGSGGQDRREVTLPWTADVEVDFIGLVIAQKASSDDSSVTCRIMKGAVKVAESTSSGDHAVATCSG